MTPAKKSHKLTWNQDQLKVAKYLYEGKTLKECSMLTGMSASFCYKIQQAIKKGDVPPDCSEEAIAAAPPSQGFGVFPPQYLPKPVKLEPLFAPQNGTSEAVSPEAPGEVPGEAPLEVKQPQVTPKKNLPPPKNNIVPSAPLSQTMFLQLVPQVQQLPLTPEIFMSYMCAVKRGYKGGIAGWLSVVSLDFWTGRNVDPFAAVSGVYEMGVQTPPDGGKVSDPQEVADGITGG